MEKLRVEPVVAIEPGSCAHINFGDSLTVKRDKKILKKYNEGNSPIGLFEA